MGKNMKWSKRILKFNICYTEGIIRAGTDWYKKFVVWSVAQYKK